MAAVSGHDHRSGFKACCTAALRLFGITPVIVLILVLYITLSAIFTGWIKPAGLLWNHGYIELALFCLEVSLLLASYFTAVIRGPGYVPFGWKPTEEALRCDLAVEILQWHGSARLQEAHGHRGKFHGTLQQRFAVHPFRGDVWHLIIPVAFGGSRRRRTQVAAKMDIDGQLVQKELFDTVQELWAVRVPNDGAYRLRQVLSMPDTEHLLLKQRKEQGIFNVVPTSQGIDISEEGNYSLLLLASEVSRNDVPNDVHQLIASFNGSFTRYSLVLNYDSFSYKEVLSRLLPSTVTVPCGYEIVGHVAHFNLQEQHWPYRFLIGQVCLDKRHCVKTVIAKQGIVSSEFRTFDMEVIAGQADTLVSLKEHGLKLQFDFRKVYWNSRLSAERGRIAAKCGKSEVMLDLCCGVGALSLLCARKGCLVIANDLNPAAILFAQQNAKLNKLNITTLCTDAQELLHATLFGTFGWEAEASTHSTSRPPRLHIVFNLPELALQILCDELRKAIDQHHVQLTGPTVDGRKSFESGCVCSIYCYTFGPSQSAVSEHLKLLTDLPEMQRAAKIRQEVSKLLKESGLVDSKELPLKIQEIPVNDLLQWCANCNGYKPPETAELASGKLAEIPKRRGLSLAAYQQEFEGQIPVVLEGVYEKLDCLKDGWIEKMIMEPFEDERVIFLAHKNGAERIMATKLRKFVKNVNKNYQNAWSYLRDEFFLQRHMDLIAACPPLPPFLEGQDYFTLMPAMFPPPNATLLWGGRYSRSKLHVDPYNWTGTNLVLRGEKFFRLIPPGGHDRMLEVVTKNCGMALECIGYEAKKDLFESVPQGIPLWETKLQNGELLIIPSGWWHQAVNLGNTLAMASGLITPRSGSWSTIAEVVRFHFTKHPSWKWGKLPELPDEIEAEASETKAIRRFRRFINALPEEVFKAAEKFVKKKSQFQRQELPRAHHCSSCSRCVLSMDHHCPWTNTCVGQINLKAFVQFVHYVPVATFHSFVILSELPALLLYAWQKARKTVDFFQVLLQIQLLLGLIAWFASLAVMLLVGTLAWDNMTMIEEYVVEKAEIRRRRNGEKRFVFPYDLGKKGNTAAILGSGLFSWLLPGGATPGDPVWPNLRSGSSHFDISIEQIAQKTEKLHRSVVMPVRQAFSGEGRCCFTYWCWVGFHFGCAVCDCEACGEPRLTVAVGEAVLVAKSEGSWAHGRSMINSERNLEVPSQPGGWLPRQCLNERAVQPYQIPFQKELQGRWEVDNVIILYAIQNQETLAVAGTFEAMARPRLPSAALHRHADKTPKISCCGVAFEDCEADDFPSCRSWDRTRTPDASPEEIIGGRFELLRSIGRGGAATMHQGKCLRTCTLLLREMCKVLDVIWTGQLVAIKSIPQESREDRKAALGEAAFLRSLDHEGVNRLVAVVEDEFCIHLILEYAKGTDLMETLLLTGPMEEEQAAGIIRQIVEVLAYCHSHGVVHRDVKPENIMISGEKPEITLVDFGLAMDAGKEVEEGEDEGTPVYLAPEVRNKPLICDGALDMFSLGVVLFAMLSGQLPARQATPELAKLVLPEISAGAGDFLARLLVEPELRLSAAEALEHPWLNAGAH
eukprot:symbB.v1.2.001591.t2/scaffold88.1/size340390/26